MVLLVKPLKFKGWNLKMVAKFWKSPEILSSFFFRFLKLDFRGVWDRNLPPQKKKASYLELVNVMGVWLMIFQYFTQIHSCLPRNTKNGKGSNFPMLSLPRSRRAAIVDKMSNHCRAWELHLEVFRMPLSKPENDTYMAFGQIISFGGCGVFFCSFACFRAKDRPAFCLILRNLLPCAAEQETFGIERSQFCAAGPSRMLSIGFGSSRVPFLCQKNVGFGRAVSKLTCLPLVMQQDIGMFLLKGKEVLTTCLELSRWVIQWIVRKDNEVHTVCDTHMFHHFIIHFIVGRNLHESQYNMILYDYVYILYTMYIQCSINTWSWFRVCNQFVCLSRYTFHDVSVLLH